jgi:hypothetical protein
MVHQPPRPGRASSFGFLLGVYFVAVGLAWLVFELVPWEPLWAMVAGLR